MSEIKIHYIDLFCGAGGTTTGVEQAHIDNIKCADVIACVNHDPHAIASHLANHPSAKHFTEDIRTLDVRPLAELCQNVRAGHPHDYIVLWASLECTNFSKAKGGMPRDADSRTLAEHLFRYIEAIRPDYIQIENVEEFMCWGDLDIHGRPVSKDKGRCYIKWVKDVMRYGYDFDYRILNAADFGAYTSRRRYFGLFARHGLPIVFPEQTYAKNGDEGGLFNTYRKWKPVRDVLDLKDEGDSIFGRKKPLCGKTLERIHAGLVKFVAGGKQEYDSWLLKYNSMERNGKHNPPSLDEPCPVVSCQNRLGIVKCQFLSLYYGGKEHNQSIDEPSGTVTTVDHHSFISVHYGNGYNRSLEQPAATLTCKDRMELVSSKFIVNYRFNNKGSSIAEPAPTICTVGQIGIADCKFLDMQYGNGTPSSIQEPSPTVTANPKQNLVTCKKWLLNTNFNNIGSDLDSPAPVITANRKHHYLMNPQFASAGGSIDKPCFTLIARMDKMPPYLISTESGDIAIVVYETDSTMTRKIKEFMAAYGIVDIKMRMLKIDELKRIQGFPSDYVLVGNLAEQKKFIGNAVEVGMSRVLCEALYSALAPLKVVI